jgi:hypothetical protein
MGGKFCGNISNHGEHMTPDGLCKGVHRNQKKEEVYVEKFDPADPENRNNPHWLDGWNAAGAGMPLDVRPIAPEHHELYRAGYAAYMSASGIDREEALLRMNTEPAKPLTAPPKPADGLQSEAWLLGWNDAWAGATRDAADVGNLTEYNEGYRAMLAARMADGESLPPNQIRAANGFPEFDPVKIPSHYNQGTIEVANFITDQGLDFTRGNVIKYVARAGKKDPEKELQDLEKAAAFLQMAYNRAKGLPAVVRDPNTKEVVWSLFSN